MAMSQTQMFIGNLPWSIRSRHLEEDFGAFGEVTDAFVAYKGRRSRGFGFVTMAKPEDAKKAQAALDGKKVGEGEHEREMRVTFAKERSPEDQAKADEAKAAAAARRTDRAKEKKEDGGEKAAPAEEKKKPKKKNNKKKGPKKEGAEGEAKPAEAKKEGKKEAAKEEKKGPDWHAEKIARKLAEAAPIDPDCDVAALRAKAQAGANLTDEEKKERGLLYDASKASAVRESSGEDDGACDAVAGAFDDY